MKEIVANNEYMQIEHDPDIDRLYTTLHGYWVNLQVDRNIFAGVLARCLDLPDGFTLVFDISVFSPGIPDYFETLIKRVGVRLGETGIKAHGQVLPQAYFDAYGLPPGYTEIDPDTGQPGGYFLTLEDAESWLDSL